MKYKEVKVEDFEEGDLVIVHDKSEMYFILKKKKTLLHKHIFYKIIYGDGIKTKWTVEQLKRFGKTREVLRLQ